MYSALKAYTDSSYKQKILFVIESPGELATAKPLMEEAVKKGDCVTVLGGEKLSPNMRKELSEYQFFSINNLKNNKDINLLLGEQEPQFDKIISGLFHPSKYGNIFKRAKSKQIPIIGIVDLSVPSTEKQPELAKMFFSIAVKCDAIIVNNKSTKDKLLKEYQNLINDGQISQKNKITKEHIFVGTDPKWLYAKNKINSFNKNEIRQSLNIAEDEVVVSFSSQPIPGNIEQTTVLKKIATAIKAIAINYPHKKITVLYLTHPREKTDYSLSVEMQDKYLDFSEFKFTGFLESFANKSPEIKILKLDGLTYEALSISTVHITETSTVGTESYYAGIPTVFLTEQTHELEILEKNLVSQAIKTEDIINNLLKVLNNVFQNISAVVSDQVTNNRKYFDIINSVIVEKSLADQDDNKNQLPTPKREISVKKQKLIKLLNQYSVSGKYRGRIIGLFSQSQESFSKQDLAEVANYTGPAFIEEFLSEQI